jgi:hypothetical protein
MPNTTTLSAPIPLRDKLFLTSKEVCQVLNISERTLDSYRKLWKVRVKAGPEPIYLSTRTIRYRSSDVHGLLGDALQHHLFALYREAASRRTE